VPKLETLRDRAAKAVNGRRFRELADLIPAAQRNDPRLVLSWFRAAAEFDRKGADTPAYKEATEALHALAEAQSTVDRASRVYHSAIASGLVTQAEADRLWADPTAAAAKIKELRSTDQYWDPLVQEAVSLHYELQSMPADDAEPAPAADDPAQPADEGEGARSGEQSRYLEIKGEDPSPEAEPVHPRDDNTERLSTPGPTL
jgi:hypothetical protein